MITVIALSGSLRRESFNTKLLRAFVAQAPEGVDVKHIEIGGLPLINQDFEHNLPPKVQALHATIKEADGVLLVTPEYNRSYSPVLKNALDWGSRPYGSNDWDGKPVGIVGCSTGMWGAFGAQHHLRQVMVFLNMHPLQQPEFYLAHAAEKFDTQGKLIDPVTQEKINEYWAAFVPWIKKVNA